MKISLLLLTLISFNRLIGQDSISVLFIGNSYTYVNDLPSLMVSFTQSKGDVITVDSRTQGGATFANHASAVDTYSKIHSKPWDYVVLQGQSQETSFSESQVNSSSLPYAMQIADSVYTSKFCSELMLFMTWGYINGDTQWQPISTYDGMQGRIRAGYDRIADSCQASVAPVGMAWKYVRENHPEINLYAGDGQHPSFEGSYLAACTFYASLFRKTPVGASYYGSLSPTVALQLQQAAEIAVMDSLEQWHLRSLAQHTIADFSSALTNATVTVVNKSWKAQSYNWDFGDGFTSTMISPSHTYAFNGNYELTLTANSDCSSNVKSQYYEITLAELTTLEQLGLTLKTIEPGLFILKSENLFENSFADFKVYDMQGKLFNTMNQSPNSVQIDLRNSAIGTYFLQLPTITIKLVH